MTFKKIASALILASATFLGTTGVAQASCTYQGQILQIYTNGSTTYVYVAPSFAGSPMPSYVGYFTTTDPEMMNALASGVTRGTYIVGNATSCPTSGTYRYGGVLSYFYLS